jgi:predicted GNAT superfamily acetyltransferase
MVNAQECIIRPLTTLDDCRRVAALEKTVWGYSDGEDVVPPPLLIVSIKRGGILLGAFDNAGEMKGFVYSFAAIKAGRLTQWSHMLGVVPEARAAGLALRLKLAQRDEARRMGIDLIEWTYDPLQALNAHLNFARLGVVVEEYEENIYGASTSPLHQGTPTDRFIAQWRLTAPHVERRLTAATSPLMRDSSVMSAVLVNPSNQAGEWLAPGEPVLDEGNALRLFVEIPADFGEMQARFPDLALAWRMATRRIFRTYLGRGFRVVDFFFARDAGRGQYLLAKKD